MISCRRLVFAGSLGLLFAAAACASTNGEAVPPETLDASPIDAGTNPSQGGGDSGGDGGPDGTVKEAASDAPADAPSDTTGLASPDLVRINELYVAGISGNGDRDEYVELHGVPGTPLVDLELRLLDSAGAVRGTVDVASAAGDVIPAGGFWVVGGSLADNVDYAPPLAIWGLEEDLGAAQLVRKSSSALVDVVGWASNPDAGAPPSAPSPPTASFEAHVATQPPTGTIAFGRKATGVDTNDNGADFCAMAKTPGAVNGGCQ